MRNLQQFSARELAKMSYALARLRFLAQSFLNGKTDGRCRSYGKEIPRFWDKLTIPEITIDSKTLKPTAELQNCQKQCDLYGLSGLHVKFLCTVYP